MSQENRVELLFAEEVFRIQGAIFQVYRGMGGGFLEAVYQECLAIEFAKRNIPFAVQRSLALAYEGQPLRQTYVADFVCFGQIIVELKAVAQITAAHRAQVFNYLRATSLQLGLLVNFGPSSRATVERLVLQDKTANPRENTRTLPIA